MSFNLDPKKAPTLEDGGRKLKVGSYAYKITSAQMAVVKSDPRGKQKQVVIEATNNGDLYKVYLSTDSPNDTAREIALKTLMSFWVAAGLTGACKPETLKLLAGKTVVIAARETQGKGENKDKTYVNISNVEPFDGGDDKEEETEDEVEESEESEEETEEETEEEETEESDPEPPKKSAAAAPKKRPWG